MYNTHIDKDKREIKMIDKDDSKTITVSIKQVYSRDTIYAACDKSRLFVSMLNRKTLTLTDIDYIKKLGYEVKVALNQVSRL
jgi:hypothetical protein